MRAVLPSLLAGALLCVVAEERTEAAVVQTKDPLLMTTVVTGTIGGLATSIAAIVYAFQDKAFDNPWIVASLITSAVTGAMLVAFVVNSDRLGGAATGAGVLLFGTLTGWPLYWTAKTALSDVDPGDPFHEPEAPEPRARATQGALIVPMLAFSF